MSFKQPQPMSRHRGGWPTVRHYYGDVVRALFVVNAIIIGALIPFSGNMQLAASIGIPVVILLVVLAGYTNPHGKAILILDAIASAGGIILAESFAIGAYSVDASYAFIAFEAISILFLVALYYSVKNVRALAQDKIGRIDGVGEFDAPEFVDSVKE